MAVTGTGTAVLNFSASGDAATDWMVISGVRWVGATAAGQLCRVTDTAGNVIFVSEANGANFVDGWYYDKKSINGIILASMNSGSFQLYLAHGGH